MQTKFLLLLLLFCLYLCPAQSQDAIKDDISFSGKPFSLSINTLSFLSGNPNIHLTFDWSILRNRSIAADLNYFYGRDYTFGEADRIDKVVLSPRGGFGGGISYRFMPNETDYFRFFIGPSVGYRNLPYRIQREVCTAVAAESACICTAQEVKIANVNANALWAAVDVGMQKNHFLSSKSFFWGFNIQLGLIGYQFTGDEIPRHVTCPTLESSVEDEYKNLVSRVNSFLSNSSFTMANGVNFFLVMKLNVGYVF